MIIISVYSKEKREDFADCSNFVKISTLMQKERKGKERKGKERKGKEKKEKKRKEKKRKGKKFKES